MIAFLGSRTGEAGAAAAIGFAVLGGWCFIVGVRLGDRPWRRGKRRRKR